MENDDVVTWRQLAALAPVFVQWVIQRHGDRNTPC